MSAQSPATEVVCQLPVIVQSLPDLRYEDKDWISKAERRIAIGSIPVRILANLFRVDQAAPDSPDGYQRVATSNRVQFPQERPRFLPSRLANSNSAKPKRIRCSHSSEPSSGTLGFEALEGRPSVYCRRAAPSRGIDRPLQGRSPAMGRVCNSVRLSARS